MSEVYRIVESQQSLLLAQKALALVAQTATNRRAVEQARKHLAFADNYLREALNHAQGARFDEEKPPTPVASAREPEQSE